MTIAKYFCSSDENRKLSKCVSKELNMAWKTLSINDSSVERYVTSKNKSVIDIARNSLKAYESVLSFGTDSRKVPVLYLVASLHEWCESKNNAYKIDFYECEKDSIEGKDWWLCLKRGNNGSFEYDEIPIGIKRSLEKVFPQTCHNFEPDNRSVCLKTSSEPNEIAQKFKEFLKDLKNE